MRDVINEQSGNSGQLQGDAIEALDDLLSVAIAAGNYSGEGCWLSDGEEDALKAKHEVVRVPLATHPQPAAPAAVPVVEYQLHNVNGGWRSCSQHEYENGKAYEAKYGASAGSLYRTLVVGDATLATHPQPAAAKDGA